MILIIMFVKKKNYLDARAFLIMFITNVPTQLLFKFLHQSKLLTFTVSFTDHQYFFILLISYYCDIAVLVFDIRKE
jgi:hypothetical protein